MKPQELRIGNLMHEHYTGKIISVIELMEKSITFTDSFIGKWQAEPIPLTEEILLKVGFDKKTTRIGCMATYQLRTIIVNLSNSGHWYFKSRVIKLHDLQNIAHSNTGQELNTAGLIK